MAPITTKTAEPVRQNTQSAPVSAQTVQAPVHQPERSPDVQTEEKPGFFRRIINWFKNLFSRKKKNTETPNGDAGQMHADTMANVDEIATIPTEAQITDTLPPAVTAEAVAEAVHEKEEPQSGESDTTEDKPDAQTVSSDSTANEGKLEIKKGFITVDFFNPQKIKTEQVEDGNESVSLKDPTFAVYLFNFKKPVYQKAIKDLGMTKNEKSFSLSIKSATAGDFIINGMSITIDFDKKSFNIDKIDSISSNKKDTKLFLTISKVEDQDNGISGTMDYASNDFGERITAHFDVENASFDQNSRLYFKKASAVLKNIKMFDKYKLVLDSLLLEASSMDESGLKYSVNVTNLSMDYSSKQFAVEINSENASLSYDNANAAGNGGEASSSVLDRLSGSINGTVNVFLFPDIFKTESGVSVSIENVSVNNGVLTVSKAESSIDLSKLKENGDLSGSFSISVNNLTFDKTGHRVGGFKMSMSQIKYKDMAITTEETIDFQEEEDGDPPEASIKINAEKLYLYGKEGEEGNYLYFSDPTLNLTITNSKFNFGIGGSASAKINDFEFTLENQVLYLNTFILKAEKASASNAKLSEAISNLTNGKVTGLSVELNEIEINKEQLSYKSLALSAETAIAITDNLTLKGLSGGYNKENSVLFLSGSMEYKNDSSSFIKSAKGKATIVYDSNKKSISLKSFEGVKASFGKIEAGVEKTEITDGKNFTFKSINISYTKGKSDDSDNKNGLLSKIPFLAKIVGFVDEAKISVDKIDFVNGIPQLPEIGDININELSGETELSNGLKLKLSLGGDEKMKSRTFNFSLSGNFGYPADPAAREKNPVHQLANLFECECDIPIFPAVYASLGLTGGLSIDSNIDFMVQFSADTGKSLYTTNLKLKAGVAGKVGVSASAGIRVGEKKLGARGAFYGSISAVGEGEVIGNIGVGLDTNKPSLKEMITVNAGLCNLNLKAGLTLDLGVEGEVDAPLIADGKGKKIYSFSFKTINIGDASFSARVLYENNMFTADSNWSYNPNFAEKKYEEYVAKQELLLKKSSEDSQTLTDVSASFGEINNVLSDGKDRDIINASNLFENLEARQVVLFYESITKSMQTESEIYKCIADEKNYVDKAIDDTKMKKNDIDRINLIANQSKERLEYIEDQIKNSEENGQSVGQNSLEKQIRFFYTVLSSKEPEDIKKFVDMNPLAFLNLMGTYKYKDFKDFKYFNWYEYAKNIIAAPKKDDNNKSKVNGKEVDTSGAIEELIRQFKDTNETLTKAAKKYDEAKRKNQQENVSDKEKRKNEEALTKAKNELQALLEGLRNEGKLNLSSAFLGIDNMYGAIIKNLDEKISEHSKNQTEEVNDANHYKRKELLVKCVLLYMVESYYNVSDKKTHLDCLKLEKQYNSGNKVDEKISSIDIEISSVLTKELQINSDIIEKHQGIMTEKHNQIKSVKNDIFVNSQAITGNTLKNELKVSNYSKNSQDDIKRNNEIINRYKGVLEDVHSFDEKISDSMKKYETLRSEQFGVSESTKICAEKAQKMSDLFSDVDECIKNKQKIFSMYKKK